MRIILNFILVLTFFTKEIKSQNLVPNPSFETLTTCPSGDSQIQLASPWISATGTGTPDIFNSCIPTSSCVSVPLMGILGECGYQMARTGNGFAGIYVYFYYSKDAFNEILETPLIEPLKKDKNYFIRFYTNPRNRPRSLGYTWTYTDAIGLALSDSLFFKQAPQIQLRELTPVIENRGNIIRDTVNWTPVSGCYRARGGEKYAIIGNFRSQVETVIEYEKEQFPQVHYMYIEDVEIVEFNPLPDTITLCNNEAKTLNAHFLDGKYFWNTGSKDSTITINKSGVYIVGVTIDKCTMYDTVTVIDPKQNAGILPDTLLCKGKSLTLKPNIFGMYKWSTGSQSSSIMVKESGKFSVTVTNDCGVFNYTSNVIFKECGCNIFVPNAFSPNADGVNDDLHVFSGCDYYPYKIKKFQIFDRWGELIFSESETNEIKWDGSFRGQQITEGVFVWTLIYELTKDGKVETILKSGNITIIR
jgi:gliding motility-associated-like protein